MKMKGILSCSLLFHCLLIVKCLDTTVDPLPLSRKVEELVEHSLKRNEMQTHLDTLSYINQPLNGQQLLDQLSSSLGIKFRQRVSVVKKLQEVVSTAYGRYSSFDQCCNFPKSRTEYDSRFKQKVSTNSVCEQISSSAVSSPKKLSSSFLNTCIQNLQALPSLKWQYFGSEQGITTQFPALPSTSSCGSFDNRFRPWYVQANVPRPKHVVIVIDKSGSMSKSYKDTNLMELAKKAAKTVIATLNPFDKFAVLAFSSSVDTPSSRLGSDNCFSSKLSQATPQNKKKLSDFVDTFRATGSTYYGIALQKAFEYLQSGYDSNAAKNSTDQVILFMSDGIPSDTSYTILQTLRTGNLKVGNSAVMMTFGLGSNIDFTVLEQMARSTTGAAETGGIFKHVTDPDRLRDEMASYYQYFASQSRFISEPIWTVPYLDGWGLGQMITASLPVYVASDLVGVAAVDVTLEELFADSTYFRPNELSYSFIINEEGLVINHPLFPYSNSVDLLYVSATAFERDAEFVSIFESMKRGESGKKSFLSSRILPQGDSRKYGVREVQVYSTYYWKQIPSTKFSICLVLANNDAQSVLTPQGSQPTGTFLYNRLDLVPPETPCVHMNNYCAMDQTSVLLASRSFSDPEYYLATSFTKSNVESIVKYMEGRGSNTERIKKDVKHEVVATYKAQSLWTEQNENTELQEQVIWRYVGTKSGVFRIYPGTQLPNNFDPVLRPWYEHALANRESNVITPPYQDAASGAVIVTMSRVLFEGKPNGIRNTTTADVFGVMGVDLLLPYFYNILLDLYPVCSDMHQCFLMDSAGYIIVAESYIKNENSKTDQHITELEPDIAINLIRNNILVSISCGNIEAGLIERAFKISSNLKGYVGKTYGNTCYNFELIPIVNTNTYLIIRDSKKTTSGCGYYYRSSCTCDKISHKCARYWTTESCECPCSTTNTNYEPCQNKYNITNDSPPPCTPENAVLSSVSQNKADLSALPQCYKVDFVYDVRKDDEGTGISTGLIAGIVVIIIIVGLIVFFTIKKCKSSQMAKQKPHQANAATAVAQTQAVAPTAPSAMVFSPNSTSPPPMMSSPAYNPNYPQQSQVYYNTSQPLPPHQQWVDPNGCQIPSASMPPSYNAASNSNYYHS